MKVLKVEARPIEPGKRVYGHCYVFPVEENIIGNLLNRRDRPHKEWKKLLPEVFKKAGLSKKEIEQIKPTWSQKCGCSCGCSPGFKLTGYTQKDLFVDVAD